MNTRAFCPTRRWQHGWAALALIAWFASWFLPTLHLGKHSYPGWMVFILSFTDIPSLFSALLTLALPVYLVLQLQSRAPRESLLVAIVGLALGTACGAQMLYRVGAGERPLGLGYGSWLASFFLAAVSFVVSKYEGRVNSESAPE